MAKSIGLLPSIFFAAALFCTTTQCGDAPPVAADAATEEAPPSIDDDASVRLPPAETGTGDCDGEVTCSADMHSVVDCHGALVQSCGTTMGCAAGECIPACDAAMKNKSAVGCEYYAHNPQMALGKGCYALFVANTWNAPVTLTGEGGTKKIDLSQYAYLPQGGGTSLTYAPLGKGGIPAGKVAIVFLTQGTAIPCPKPTAQTDINASEWNDPQPGTNKDAIALRVVSSAPVVAYDIQPFGGGGSAVTDATLLLPTSTWGTNYVAVTPWAPSFNTMNPSMAIVASADNTQVTFRPSVDVVGGTKVPSSKANTPVVYTMSKGQVIRLSQPEDLIGSVISSNKPVGVWGEQECINIDQFACDGAHEQIPPVAALGDEYVYARYRNRTGADETPPTRIVGAVDGTTLTWDPPQTGAKTTVDEGESFIVRSSGPFIVKSQDDKHPFYVATYMTGGMQFNNIGDPEFVNVVPAKQYLSRYVFFTDPTYPETNLVFVRKRAKDSTFKDVTLDCGGVIKGWKPVGKSGQYEWTLRDLVTDKWLGVDGCDNGAHEAKSDGPFGLTVWGWGNNVTTSSSLFGQTTYVSYAYPAGAGVESINTVIVPTNPK